MTSHTPSTAGPAPGTASTDRFVAYPDGCAHEVVRTAGGQLLVHPADGGSPSLWQLDVPPQQPMALTQLEGERAGPEAERHTLAAMQAAFEQQPGRRSLVLHGTESLAELRHCGVLLPDADGPEGALRAWRDTLWQQPRLWLPEVHAPMALRHALTDGKRHPVRPPKPLGLLYQRYVPWVGKTFSFRSFDRERDLPMFHRWMNDPDVAHVWEEAGDLEQHRAYIDAIGRDPHMHSMVASFDGEPFAYFEIYWAKESRIAPFYDVHDYDRGWHVLVGEPAFRGRAFATAWLTSISHYIFLCDARTGRAMGEPRIDHLQQIRNLDKSGYAKVKEFDLPHKRALLVSMLRERYFTDALWLPHDDAAPVSGRPLAQAL